MQYAKLREELKNKALTLSSIQEGSADSSVRGGNVALREDLRGARGGDDVFQEPEHPHVRKKARSGDGVRDEEKGGPKRKVATEEGASKKPARVSVPPVQSMAAKYGFPHKHPPKQKKIAANPDQKNSGTHKDPRCKRCGRLKKSDVIAQGMHGNRVEKRSRAYCKVDEEHYMPGYPKRGYEDLE